MSPVFYRQGCLSRRFEGCYQGVQTASTDIFAGDWRLSVFVVSIMYEHTSRKGVIQYVLCWYQVEVHASRGTGDADPCVPILSYIIRIIQSGTATLMFIKRTVLQRRQDDTRAQCLLNFALIRKCNSCRTCCMAWHRPTGIGQGTGTSWRQRLRMMTDEATKATSGHNVPGTTDFARRAFATTCMIRVKISDS